MGFTKSVGRWAGLTAAAAVVVLAPAMAAPAAHAAVTTPTVVAVETTAVPAKIDNDDSTKPKVPGGNDGEVEQKVNTVIGWGKWIALVAGVGGLIISGVMMAVGRRNRSALASDGALGLPWALGGISVALLAIPVVNAIA
jgi:hypothetical protein